MDSREIYREEIYEYCEKNIGEKGLFTRFQVLWQTQKKNSDERYEVVPKDLAILTSNIHQGLLKEGILREVEKPEGLDFSPYGFYEILPH